MNKPLITRKDEHLGRTAWAYDQGDHLWHVGPVVDFNPANLEIIESRCGKRVTGYLLHLIWAESFDYDDFNDRSLVCATCAAGAGR